MRGQFRGEGSVVTKRSRCIVALLVCAAFLSTAHVGARAGWVEDGQKIWKSLIGGERGAQRLSSDEIAAGLREALRVGTNRVVHRLGVLNGFYADPAVHIPLPESLEVVRSTLNRVGMSGAMDDLELRLNRAAETATPKAKQLFIESIQSMSLEDVRRIYEGPDDAATRYFQNRMSASLAREMTPIVEEVLAEVGAIRAYENAMGRYESIPFLPDVKADLTAYVVDQGMEGIFYYLAREEAAIRRNPVKRTTELLEKVFGAEAAGS